MRLIFVIKTDLLKLTEFSLIRLFLFFSLIEIKNILIKITRVLIFV